MRKKPVKENTKIDKIKSFFTSKKVWTRIMFTLGLIGLIAFIVLKDNSCNYKGLNCDSKSKINLE